MSRLGAVLLVLCAVAEPARSQAAAQQSLDDETPEHPSGQAPSGRDGEDPRAPAPPPVLHRQAVLGLSFLVRVPTGPGVDVSLYPVPRVEIGGSVSSCLFFSGAGAYTRVSVIQRGVHNLSLGARMEALLVVIPDTDGDPTRHLVSAELGYSIRDGSLLFGAEVGKVLLDDYRWAGVDRGGSTGFSGEIRLGHLW